MDHLGANVINCEAAGGGQIAKTCNNMALAIQMVSVGEALALSQKMGLDPKKMAEIMVTASSRCWSIDTYAPISGFLDKVLPADNNFDGGFANELLVRKIELIFR